jgi:hypothetical protein
MIANTAPEKDLSKVMLAFDLPVGAVFYGLRHIGGGRFVTNGIIGADGVLRTCMIIEGTTARDDESFPEVIPSTEVVDDLPDDRSRRVALVQYPINGEQQMSEKAFAIAHGLTELEWDARWENVRAVFAAAEMQS